MDLCATLCIPDRINLMSGEILISILWRNQLIHSVNVGVFLGGLSVYITNQGALNLAIGFCIKWHGLKWKIHT